MNPPSSPSFSSFQPSSPSPLFQNTTLNSPTPSSSRASTSRVRPPPPPPTLNSSPIHHRVSNGNSSSPRGSNQPSKVADKLWRDRFRQKCADRVGRERAAAVRREREREGVIWSSSDGVEGEDVGMDDGGEEDEEIEEEIFRRIINSQDRRTAREQARLAEAVLPQDLDALIEDQEQAVRVGGLSPSRVAGGADEYGFDDDELESAYMQALMASEDWSTPTTTALRPPLTPPPCPQCNFPPPYQARLLPALGGALSCPICGFHVEADVAKYVAQGWNHPHSGSSTLEEHIPLLSAVLSLDGTPLLSFACSGPSCTWTPHVS